MITRLLFIFSLIFSSAVFAQNKPDFIRPVLLSDIELRTAQAKTLIQKDKLTGEEAIQLSLLLELEDEVEMQSVFRSLRAFVDKEIICLYKPNKHTKSIEKISEKLEQKYFKTYQEEATVKSSILFGEFNISTGAMIQAYVFDRLGIEYLIKGNGIAYYLQIQNKHDNTFYSVPGAPTYDDNLPIEFYEEYADHLLNIGVISEVEILTMSSKDIYKKMGDDPENIPLTLPVGVNITTSAAAATYQEDYEEAYNLAKISHYICDLYGTSTFVFSYSANLLLNLGEHKSARRIEIMEELLRYNNRFFEHEYVINNLAVIYKNTTKENNTLETFKTHLPQIENLHMLDSTRLAFEWHYKERYCTYYLLRGQLDSSYKYALIAYDLSPQDLLNQKLFYGRFADGIRNYSFSEAEDEYNTLMKKYPELKDNPYFLSIFHNILLYRADEFVTFHKYDKAESLIQEFEESFAKQTSDIKPAEEFVQEAYGRLAIYYFSTNNSKRALSLINKGLELYPDNRKLQYKKLQITGD